MNSPTIAAVVPGIKPQAERSSSSPDAEPGSSFADALAEQSASAPGAETRTETAPASDVAAAQKQSGESTQPAHTADSADAADALEDTETQDVVVATLPQIALEIALHARDQATRAKASASSAVTPELVDSVAGASGRNLAADTAALANAMQGQAASAQAENTRGRVAQTALAETSAKASAADPIILDTPARSENAGRSVAERASVHQTSLSPTAPGAGTHESSAARRSNASTAQNNLEPRAAIDPALFTANASRTIEHGHATLEAGQLAFVQAAPGANGAPAGLNPFAQTLAATPATGPAVATPLHQLGWDADLGRQVVMLARDTQSGMQTAQLRLDPPDLGPLRISLSLNDGLASAVFVSAHASVRQAVEAALPQLSQQLAQAGISLGQTHVGDQGQAGFSFSEGQGGSGSRHGVSSSEQGGAAAETVAASTRTIAANALVDTFA